MNDSLTIRAPRTVPTNDPHAHVAPEEALANARAFFQGDELAATTWVNKYALRDAAGELVERSPSDMHRRMAREFARIEARYAPVPAETWEDRTADMVLSFITDIDRSPVDPAVFAFGAWHNCGTSRLPRRPWSPGRQDSRLQSDR